MKDAIGFWENKGQVKNTAEQPASEVKFYTQGAYPRAYFQNKTRISFVLASRDTTVTVPDTLYRLDMRCVGNNARDVDPQAYLVKTYHQNFYLRWTGTGVEQVYGYSRLVYPGIYPYIDLHFYSGPRGQKMAFVCHPGSDPADIRLQFTGNDDIDVDLEGNLRLLFGNKWVPFREAVAFQYDQNLNITNLGCNASYAIDSALSISNFTFSSFDPTKPLVLQIGPYPAGAGGPIETPGLCWSTYFGGDQRDIITSSTQDEQGNYFVAGRTGSGPFEFPAAPGTDSYDATGGDLAFVVKMDQLDRMVWRAFLGGQGDHLVWPHAVVTKPSNGIPGRVYIAGRTNSPNLNTAESLIFPNAYFQGSSPNNGWTGFLASFANSTNSPTDGQRLWTSYFGSGDELLIYDMTKATNGDLYLTGLVYGALPGTQDPPPSGAEDYGYHGGGDAFIAMFNAQDRLNWRTHYGGSSGDVGKSVVANGSKVLIAGDTQSADIITVDGGSNAWDEAYSGSWVECFAAEFDLSGEQRWGTCYAGEQGSLGLHGKGLALDPTTGDVVMSGHGSTTTLPIVPGAGWYNEEPTGSFLARFSGSDRSLVWSTYLTGGHGQDSRVVIFDAIGNLYVSGLTSDLEFPVTPLNGMYINETPIPDVSYFDPIGPVLITEQVDMYVMCFTPDHWLAWSTYFGGEAGSSYEGLYTLLHRNGDLYAAGFTTKSILHWVGPLFESYFPLHDTQVPGVHFEDNYSDVPNFDGLPTTDAFITRFCASPLTFVPERVSQTETALHAWQQGGHIIISGLPIGTHRVLVSDAAGRIVGQLMASSDGQLGSLRTMPWAEGSYVLQFPDLRKHVRLLITW